MVFLRPLKSLVTPFVYLLLFLAYLTSTRAECILSNPEVEGYYDLSSLQGTIFSAQTAEGGYTYHFAVCGVDPTCDNLSDAAVCQSWDGGSANCGIWNATAIETFPIPSPEVPGIALVVRDGDQARFSYIYIHCDPNILVPTDFAAQAPQTLLDPNMVHLTHQSGCVKQFVPGESPITVSPTSATPPSPSIAPSPPQAPISHVPIPTPIDEVPIQAPIGAPEFNMQPSEPQQIPAEQPPILLPPVFTPIEQTPVFTPIEQTPVFTPIEQTPVFTPIEQTPIFTPVDQPPFTAPALPPTAPPALPPIAPPSKPVKKGLSVGSILLITLVCISFVYFFGGFLILKCYQNRQGVETIPNHTFWMGLPGLVKDGFYFAFSPCTGGYTRSYEMIPA